MKNSTFSSRQSEIIEAAVQRQRQRHRPAGEQRLQMENPRPAVGPAGAGRDVAERDRRYRSCARRHRRCPAAPRAPDAERERIEHRADLVADLPVRASAVGQARLALLIPVHVERADGAGHDQKRDARPEQTLPVFTAVMTAAIAAQSAPANIGAGILEQRIDQRRVNRRRHSSDRMLRFDRPSCIERARVLFRRVVLPVADEVFLREHRYRDVVFRPAKRKSAR